MALTGAHPNHSQFLHPTVSSSGTLPQFTIGQQSTPTTVDSSAMALHSLMAAAAAAASGNSMSGFSSLSSVGQSSMEQFMAAGGAMATSQQDAALFFKAAALQASFAAAAASGVATDSGPSSTSSSSNLAPSVNSLSDLTERRSVDVDQSCESHQVDTVKSEATLSPPPSSTHDHSPPTSMGRPTSISPPTTALGGHTTPLQKLQSLSPNTIIGEQFAAAAAAAGRSLKFSIDNILSPNFGTQVEQAARSMMLQAHYGAAVAAAAAAASHPTAHLTSANQAANPLLAFYQQMQEKYVSQQLALVNQSLQLQQQQQQQAALAAATAHFQQQQQQRAFAHPFGAPHSMPVTHQAPIPVQSKLGFDINAINNNNTLLNRKNSTTTHHVESRKRKRSDSESSTISSLSAQSKENPMAPTHSPKMIKREETAKLPKPVSKPCDDIKRSNPPPSATDSNPDADSLDKPLDEKIKQPTLWPAWVYCTRYSDRPSSGPRSRKMPKKPKEKKQTDEKRPRTAFTAEQLARLKQEFQENRYLNEKRRQDLARDLKLNESQIKIWFQNKRAKIKKSTGNRNPLALHLMAQGLYNHSTMAMDGEEDEEMDGDDDDDARSHGDNAPNSPNE